MYSRDYTQEIGLSTGEKFVPLAVALPLLGVMSVGAVLGVNEVNSSAQHEAVPVKMTAAPTTQAVAQR